MQSLWTALKIKIYYFNAYTDLEDGNIYSINGFADDSPEIMNPKTYTRFMSITEE